MASLCLLSSPCHGRQSFGGGVTAGTEGEGEGREEGGEEQEEGKEEEEKEIWMVKGENEEKKEEGRED